MRNLSELIDRGAERWPELAALKYRNEDTGEWLSVCWRELKERVYACSSALVAEGVAEEDNVAIFSQNKPESFVVDLACFNNRAVTVPLYATSSAAQAQYILNDAGVKLLFVGEQYQYDIIFSVLAHCHGLHRVVIYDPSVVRNERDTISIYYDEFIKKGRGLPHNDLVLARKAKGCPGDLANLLYTSGTTGEPKGVEILHSCWIEAFRIHHQRLSEGMKPGDVSMNFLPLTHVFERGWCYVCLYEGMTIAVNLSPQAIRTTIKEVHPTHMCSVPRFWEKVYMGFQQKMENETPVVRTLMQDAMRVGKKHNVDYLRLGKKPPLWLRLKYRFYDRMVYSALKKELGLENAKFFPTAGAAVSTEICEFVHSMGINMIVGYGLTESTATVSCGYLDTYAVGAVGDVMDGLEVKIGAGDEVLLRGKTIMRGYFRKSEANARAFDADGFFHTGDTGWLEGRTLFLSGRMKDLMKTSNGKYISPQALEAKLGIDRYIDQVAVIADGRKFVSALIVPDYQAVKAYAATLGIDAGDDHAALLASEQIYGLFKNRIDTLQQEFAHYEQIKRFTLLPKPFSMASGELTNTLKLRRKVVTEHYKEWIDKMYEDQ